MTTMIPLQDRLADHATVLDGREWTVVTLALREAASGMGQVPTGAVGRFMAKLATLLTGVQPPRPLADPRLEALRRFAVSAVAGGDHDDNRQALLALGYLPMQLATIERMAR